MPDLSRMAEIGDDFLPMMNELRERGPIIWNEKARVWMVTRHEDVVAGFQRKVPLSNEAKGVRALDIIPPEQRARRYPAMTGYIGHWFLFLDPPRHTRLRSVFMRGFTPGVIGSVRPSVRALIAELFDRQEGKAEVDLLNDVLRRVTVGTIMGLIGIPLSYIDDVSRWSDAITLPFVAARPTVEILDRAERAFTEMAALLMEQIAERTEKPRDDFLSQVVQAAREEKLTQEELIAQFFMLLTAGHESTTNTIGFSLAYLSRNRDRWAPFLEPPERNGAAITELMRFVAMGGGVARVAAESFEWHGQRIAKGDFVFLMVSSANRDPRAFDDPETLDVARRNQGALMFGHGAHHCIGHLLARMEVSEFIPAFLSRFPDMRLRDEALAYGSGLLFRNLETLWIRPGAPAPRSDRSCCR